jgi:hypothetical protein
MIIEGRGDRFLRGASPSFFISPSIIIGGIKGVRLTSVKQAKPANGAINLKNGGVGRSSVKCQFLDSFRDEATRQVENHLPEFFVAYFLTTVRRFSDP